MWLCVCNAARYGNEGPSSYLSNINIEQLFLRLVMLNQQQKVGVGQTVKRERRRREKIRQKNR